MTLFLVIGYGNELRGDDAVGPAVARCVSAWNRPEVAGLPVHQLTPELAAVLADAEIVIFVDASADPAQREVRLEKLESGSWTTAGHTSDPRCLLTLTEALYDRRPEAWLIIIPASDFSFGARLSPKARAGREAALRRIHHLHITRKNCCR
jgi:hydrogenase maturation protease